QPGRLGNVLETAVGREDAGQANGTVIAEHASAQGGYELAGERSAQRPQARLQACDGALQTRRLPATRWRVGVVLDHLPVARGVQQAVEPTVEAGLPGRVGRLLSSELDGWPRPGQSRPPVRITQDALHRRVDQSSKEHCHVT